MVGRMLIATMQTAATSAKPAPRMRVVASL
jgi:hypothetical protein